MIYVVNLRLRNILPVLFSEEAKYPFPFLDPYISYLDTKYGLRQAYGIMCNHSIMKCLKHRRNYQA